MTGEIDHKGKINHLQQCNFKCLSRRRIILISQVIPNAKQQHPEYEMMQFIPKEKIIAVHSTKLNLQNPGGKTAYTKGRYSLIKCWIAHYQVKMAASVNILQYAI